MDTLTALAGFDLRLLERESQPVVFVDTSGVLRWVNAAWSRDAPDVAARFGLGTSYLDGISGELHTYFEGLLGRCITTGTTIEQRYECSTPNELRDFHVRLLPIADAGALLVHSLVASRPVDRAVCEPGETTYRGIDGLIRQCSHCRRVRRVVGVGWDWVPAWVQSPPARVSHGLCSPCIGFYWGRGHP